MSEIRSLLENVQGQVDARPGSLERVLKRHHRKQRNQRIAAGAVAVVAAAAAFSVAGRALRFGERPNLFSAAPTISATNVSELGPAVSIRTSGVGSSSPVVVDSVLYATSIDGELFAFDVRTGADRWKGRTAAGILSEPEVTAHRVYVHGGGTLYAFDVACGTDGAACAPEWTSRTGSEDPSAPAASRGIVYVTSDNGSLLAFEETCGTEGETCEPTWTARNDGHLAVAPVVAEGVVWDTSSQALAAFPVSCASGPGGCEPLVRDVRSDGAQLSSGPAVQGGIVYVGGSDGTLYAIPATCATEGLCDPLWTGRTEAAIVDTPIVHGDRVYVGSNDGRLYAFPAACGTDGAPCDPLWVGHTGGAIDERLVAANGVVYAASTDGNLYAFPEACGSTGDRCAPLLVMDVGSLPASPTLWANKVIFETSAEGALVAYTVGGSGA